MKANQAELPVRALCETLKVSTSGCYDWRDRPLSQRRQANTVLSESIRRAHRAGDETYGMPRIRAELADADSRASRKRIARLMRAMGIQGASCRRAWCVTTKRNQRQRPAPDLVTRVFVAKQINALWVADMTYIPTWEGFLYLTVATDACSRKVVGWAFGVQMATESFFATLECELIARRSWKTKTEARLAVFTWIESWYNPHRRHSALNYLSPNNFEKKHQDNTINTKIQIIPELH